MGRISLIIKVGRYEQGGAVPGLCSVRWHDLKGLLVNAALFVEILKTRGEAFAMVDPELSTIEQALYSARFAVLIGVANDEMRQLQTYFGE